MSEKEAGQTAYEAWSAGMLEPVWAFSELSVYGKAKWARVEAALHHGAHAEITRLRAENAGLREALESIAANTCCDKCQEAALVARAALEKAKGASDE